MHDIITVGCVSNPTQEINRKFISLFTCHRSMKREGDERVGKKSQTSAKKRGRDGRQKTSNGTLKP